MKLVCKLLAALLLWLFIACNDTERGGAAAERKSDKGAQAEMMVSPQENTDGTAPVATLQTTKLTPQRILKDGEVIEEAPPAAEALKDVKIGDKEEEYNTEDYDRIVENRFLTATQNPLSTFSIDVDEAAYSNIRRYINNGSIPPAGAVRIEEMINYFDYTYPQPTNDEPFSVNTELSECPWNSQHRLVHIGLQGKEIPLQNLPNANIVFLIDVSGSMTQ
jgi:Ca-activated chloride channel family protein